MQLSILCQLAQNWGCPEQGKKTDCPHHGDFRNRGSSKEMLVSTKR